MIMGEKMRDNLTGEVFEVKKIVKERELLRDETGHPRDKPGHRQCLTGLNSLKLLYEKPPVGFAGLRVQL